MKNKIPFPKAVLFDFDGVISDSMDVHYKAWSDAFYKLFQKEIPAFPHDTHAGKSPYNIAEYFCETQDKKELSESLFTLKADYLHKTTITPKLFPGVREIQSFLFDKQIAHGIASNSTKAFIKNTVEDLNLGFDTFLGLEDYTSPKPAPEPYISLATKLNVKQQDFKNTWVFEDSITGITAAKNANMIPIGIGTQYSDEELINAGSKIVFPTLLEAYTYLLNY